MALAGCAGNLPQPPRSSVQHLSAFALAGRLAIRQGEQQYYVSVDWRHDAQRDELLLTTPLGQGIAELIRDVDGARLRLADRREFSASDWDTLAEQVFGFRLPLEAATHWLLGKEAAAAGWRMAVVAHSAGRPVDLEFERDDIHVRLKIDEWLETK
jgi:outer membrane lipoprotein LolB